MKSSLTLPGTKTDYIQRYSPQLLETLPRALNRNNIDTVPPAGRLIRQ
ncbi:hypothetical protein [Erwinia tasmaniensis]